MKLRGTRLSSVGLVLGLAVAAWAQQPTFTDPAQAGPDFPFQGEYLGMAGDQTWGAQVIALGDGKFEIVGYRGGLPGAGWQRGDETRRALGQREGAVVTFQGDEFTATIRDGVLTVFREGEKVAELPKVERKSPTLGAPAPSGALVLFDGTSVDAFEHGKLVEGNLLGATNCVSKRTFGDHSLHIEFRTPFMPNSRGQARGNSGVYVQGRYEVQILDSFGLEGKDNECGGIYRLAAPRVNMCFPPLSWQTYDIDFTAARYDAAGKKVANARITVKHNGVTIHDDLELPSGTPGYKPEGPEKLGLFLQNHGNPVVFRNIWVVER